LLPAGRGRVPVLKPVNTRATARKNLLVCTVPPFVWENPRDGGGFCVSSHRVPVTTWDEPTRPHPRSGCAP